MGALSQLLSRLTTTPQLEELRSRISVSGGRGRSSSGPQWPSYYQGNPWNLIQERLEYPEAFKLIPTVFTCVTRIQQDIARLPVRFYRGTGPDRVEIQRSSRRSKDRNIRDVWEDANPRDSSVDLVMGLHGNLDIHGTSYLFLDRQRGTTVKELQILPAHLVRPIPAKGSKTMEGYEYLGEGAPRTFAAEQVIQFRYWNPEDEPVGLSPLEPIRLAYETRWNAARFNKRFFELGGMANGIFEVTDDALLNPEDEKRYEDKLAEKLGLSAAMRPLILSGLKWVRTGLTQQEMNLEGVLDWTDADICRVYGIPPLLIGIQQQSAIGNGAADQQMVMYVWNSLMPRVALRDAALNEQFCPLFGDDIRVETDFGGIPALQNVLLNQMTGMTTGTGRPCFTVDEMRKLVGKEEAPDQAGQGLVMPFNLVAAGPLESGSPAPITQPMPKPAESPDPAAQAASRLIEEARRREAQRGMAMARVALLQRKLERAWIRLCDRQERELVQALERELKAKPQRAKAAARAVDLDAILRSDDPEMQEVKRLLLEVIRERGEEALAEIGLDLQFKLNSHAVSAFIQDAAQRINVPVTTTRTAMLASLAEGVAASEGFTDLVARIHAVMETRRGQAATIARTEVMPAYNFTSREAYRQSGVVQQMEWLTARDDAVRSRDKGDRFDHAAADGEVTGLDGTFSRTGQALRYPGDPAGDPANIINCRCTVIPVIEKRAQDGSGHPDMEAWFKGS